MSISIVLGVVIGLSFLYAALSLVASGVNELISSALGLRAHTLERGVKNLLDNPATAAGIYGHPLIQSLFQSGRSWLGVRRLPSYIPAGKFALALLDRNVSLAVGGTASSNEITSAIAKLPEGRTRETLDILWRDSECDVKRFRKGVEKWFDDGMERVSGWYRRRVQLMLVCLGLVIAVGLNVNTLTVTQRLWGDAPLRTALVEQAQKAQPPTASDKQGVQTALDNIQSGLQTVEGLSLPIGWSKETRPGWGSWHIALTGWLLTVVAISLGAPFWFDVLGRAARFRSTGVRLQTAEPASAEREPSQPAGD